MIFRDRLRFRIGHINHVILVDIDAARPAELRPLVDEIAVLIENLDAVVLPVTDQQPASLVHGDRMWNVEFARC